MATPTIYYYDIWKSITFNGSTLFTAYWADLSPQHPTFSWSWNQLKATAESSYDVYWFQVGNSVLAYTFTFVSWEVAGSATIDLYLFKDDWWWTQTGYHKIINTWQLVANGYSRYYTELAIDYWQIWSYADYYRLILQFNHSAWYTWTYQKYFSINNFYADTDVYTEWLITVQWTNLVYTDYAWYKHLIQYDSNYRWSYVDTSNSWKVWVQTWVARRLYYVDANGYVRRTYEADNRYWSTSWQWVNVWSQYAWSLRTWSAWASWASGKYLCYVNPNWYKMRIMNWDPNNF